MAEPIVRWWGEKPLSEVRGQSCRDYVAWRIGQPSKRTKTKVEKVSETTARHELDVLRAAIKYWHREHGPLVSVPVVTVPTKTPPRDDYFWSRTEAAQRIRAARRRPETQHIVRLIMIGLYTGTRSKAMLRLRWLPSTEGGWIDLDNEILFRRPARATRTKKRQPPVRIHRRLLAHLRAWRREDLANGITSVIHFGGRPITHCRQSWVTVRKLAGSTRQDGPHVLRHTSCTWFMQAGADVAHISGFLGVSVPMLLAVYGHHHPQFQTAIAQLSPRKRMNQERTR
jgi:integrase